MLGIYTLLILSSLLVVGTALKCYDCRSDISWDDCMQNSEKGTCSNPFLTRCGKMTMKATVTVKSTGQTINTIVYGKGCAKTCNTDDIDICRSPNITCNMHCCSGDYCNAGSNLVASVITAAICALISVIFTKIH